MTDRALDVGPADATRSPSRASVATAGTHAAPARPRWRSSVKHASNVLHRHATKHTGVGVVCAVAYFDP